MTGRLGRARRERNLRIVQPEVGNTEVFRKAYGTERLFKKRVAAGARHGQRKLRTIDGDGFDVDGAEKRRPESNFGLSATFRAQIGGKVFNNYRAEFENITGIGLKNIMASWLDDTTFTGPVTYSSKYLEDASFLKLDNVSLSYNIGFRNAYLKNIRVYLSAQNVFCLTGYKGVDPEVSLSGLNPGIESTTYYPRTRTFTLGATFTF